MTFPCYCLLAVLYCVYKQLTSLKTTRLLFHRSNMICGEYFVTYAEFVKHIYVI